MIRNSITAIAIAIPLALSGCMAQQYEADCTNIGIPRGHAEFAKCMTLRELVQMQKDQQFQNAILGAAAIYQAGQPPPLWAPQQPTVLLFR